MWRVGCGGKRLLFADSSCRAVGHGIVAAQGKAGVVPYVLADRSDSAYLYNDSYCGCHISNGVDCGGDGSSAACRSQGLAPPPRVVALVSSCFRLQ